MTLAPPQRPKLVTPAADLAAALDSAHDYLTRFVAFPSQHAAVASTLWAAHAHTVDTFDSTPRLAFLSPEPGSGKSRALEVIAALVPHPMHAVNCTPAALFRSVADLDARPTILYDEIDTVFGPKAKDNEEIRGFLNAGHRQSGVAYRCVGLGTQQKVMPFPAFCAVAVAGLNDVPDTIATRAVIVRMRRRAPHERVDPFRPRLHEPPGREIAAALVAALCRVDLDTNPDLPDGVTDRPADVWEPLVSIAQAAGARWATLAADACSHFAHAGTNREPSLALRLLADLRDIFTQRGDPDGLPTAELLHDLVQIDEAPWSDLRGKPLDSRGLARYLRRYEVDPVVIRWGAGTPRGYRRGDLWDAWSRYLPPPSSKSATSATHATEAREAPGGSATSGTASATSGTASATSMTQPVLAVAPVADVAQLDRNAPKGRAGADPPGSLLALLRACSTCGTTTVTDPCATCRRDTPQPNCATSAATDSQADGGQIRPSDRQNLETGPSR